MKAKIQIANYGGESLKGKKVEWKLDYAKDERYPNGLRYRWNAHTAVFHLTLKLSQDSFQQIPGFSSNYPHMLCTWLEIVRRFHIRKPS